MTQSSPGAALTPRVLTPQVRLLTTDPWWAPWSQVGCWWWRGRLARWSSMTSEAPDICRPCTTTRGRSGVSDSAPQPRISCQVRITLRTKNLNFRSQSNLAMHKFKFCRVSVEISSSLYCMTLILMLWLLSKCYECSLTVLWLLSDLDR